MVFHLKISLCALTKAAKPLSFSPCHGLVVRIRSWAGLMSLRPAYFFSLPFSGQSDIWLNQGRCLPVHKSLIFLKLTSPSGNLAIWRCCHGIVSDWTLRSSMHCMYLFVQFHLYYIVSEDCYNRNTSSRRAFWSALNWINKTICQGHGEVQFHIPRNWSAI